MKKFNRPRSQEGLFVWRRAYRAGRVSRGDLVATFNCAETKATNLLKTTLENSKGRLKREGRYLVPAPWARAKPPPWADEDDLMLQLERRKHNPETITGLKSQFIPASKSTGLTPSELPVFYDDWITPKISSKGLIRSILQSIREDRPVWIEYTGMGGYQSSEWRRIFPLSLQRVDGTWRIYAQDLELDGYPLRNFKIARVSDHVNDDQPPKALTVANPIPPKHTYTVKWNPQFSADQKTVIGVELGIKNQQVTLYSTTVYEFKLRYTGKPHGDIAWPPFTEITRC